MITESSDHSTTMTADNTLNGNVFEQLHEQTTLELSHANLSFMHQPSLSSSFFLTPCPSPHTFTFVLASTHLQPQRLREHSLPLSLKSFSLSLLLSYFISLFASLFTLYSPPISPHSQVVLRLSVQALSPHCPSASSAL